MMIIMKAFANRRKTHKPILWRIDAFIVRSLTPKMSRTINQPSYMECAYVAKNPHMSNEIQKVLSQKYIGMAVGIKTEHMRERERERGK